MRATLSDPISGKDVPALKLKGSGLELIAIPDRALDVYSLRFAGTLVSYTDPRAGISPSNFVEDGVEGFSKNFFAGFLTTCGLIQSGRPCEEGGRRFGLHGRISNTPCREAEVREDTEAIVVTGVADEIHLEGERMRLERTIRLDLRAPILEIRDRVTNFGSEPTPFMIMYHINFGAPFLSEELRLSADFEYVGDRDTGAEASAAEAVKMGARGSSGREKVYYTRADLEKGVRLESPATGVSALIQAEGLNWLGLWKSFSDPAYALGVEPCNCPGLGRAAARERGLLPMLMPGETRESAVRAQFSSWRTMP
ncbi:MAG: aldose 1-epimerase family protein [Clostridiales bacterium]|jgi:hypothetical protein|nr:aldose 1-epimerase family protein [Clostridiales bacterium]